MTDIMRDSSSIFEDASSTIELESFLSNDKKINNDINTNNDIGDKINDINNNENFKKTLNIFISKEIEQKVNKNYTGTQFFTSNFKSINSSKTNGISNKNCFINDYMYELQNFQCDTEQIWVCVLSKDNKFICTGGKTGTIKVWRILNIVDSIEIYNTFYDFNDDNDNINDKDLTNNSNNKKKLNNNNNDYKNVKRFLNLVEESAYKIFNEHKSDVVDIAWSEKNVNLFVSVSIDNLAVLYDVNMNTALMKFKHFDILTSVCFYPNVALKLENKKIYKIYRTSTINVRGSTKEIDQENIQNNIQNNIHNNINNNNNNNNINNNDETFSNFSDIENEDYFLTTCLNHKIYLWNIKNSSTPFFIISVSDNITSSTFSPDGMFLCLGGATGNLLIYKTPSNFRYECSFHIRNKKGKYSEGRKITNLKFLNKNKILISTNDSRIRIINFYDGIVLKKFKGHTNEQGMLRANYEEKNNLVISPSEDGYVYIWKIIKSEPKEYVDIINSNDKNDKKYLELNLNSLENEKENDYEYFYPIYDNKKNEFCTTAQFINHECLYYYNTKIRTVNKNLYANQIIILTTNKGYLKAFLIYKILNN